MTAAGVRRARHPCRTLIVVCTVLTATAPSSFGFQVAVPSSSRGSSSSSERSSSSSRSRDHSSSERRASRPRTLGQTHRAQQRVSAGIVLYEEGVRHLRRRESALLSQLEDSTDEGGQEQQQVFESPAEAQKPTAATAAAAPPVTVAAPRRYMGDGAGIGDEGGVGGPKGDGRGKEWTVDLCCKRLSLLHRKLRQVKSLQAQQARDPDSIDDAQRAKLLRKQNLVAEISELELLRRDLRETEWESGGGSSAAPKKEKTSRLPPGPFAGINAAGERGAQQQPEGEGEGEDDGAEYTRDGLRLASPKRQLQRPKPAAAAADAAAAGVVGQPTTQPTGGRPAAATAAAPAAEASHAFKDGDLFADGSGAGADIDVDVDEEVSKMAAMLKASMDGTDGEDEGDGGFNWEEGYKDMEGQVAEAEAAEAAAPVAQMSPMMEAPAGGYPKRLAGMMSFCRVSDKATCEILVEMGRVTVNGVVARDSAAKVDLLTDIVVANGVAVTFPGKIDNSDETRKPREDEGKRTGPIPKAEKNTWKQKTKYRWGMDEGLLAKRTRRAANAKTSEKKRRGSGGGYDDW